MTDSNPLPLLQMVDYLTITPLRCSNKYNGFNWSLPHNSNICLLCIYSLWRDLHCFLFLLELGDKHDMIYYRTSASEAHNNKVIFICGSLANTPPWKVKWIMATKPNQGSSDHLWTIKRQKRWKGSKKWKPFSTH